MNRQKLNLKYTFNCSPINLFFALYKPGTLQNWMADRVEYNADSHIFIFHWSDFSESAKMLEKNEDKMFLKLQWLNDGSNANQEYLSFQVSDADDDWNVDLYVEDFCDINDEGSQREYWDGLMEKLGRVIN